MATKPRFNRFSGFLVVRHVAGHKVRVKPSFGDWVSAHHIHRRFASRLGAQHIATTRALACLSAVVRQHRPKTVLEFGAGIGTLTYLLLGVRDPRLNVVALETNPFCLAQLERNIPEEFKPRLTVIATAGSVPQMHFDLIVVDGRLPATQDWAFLQRGTVLFVEGDREYQCSKLMRIARTKNLVCDLDKQSFGELSLGRQKTRFGFYVPIFRRRKTCRVGVTE